MNLTNTVKQADKRDAFQIFPHNFPKNYTKSQILFLEYGQWEFLNCETTYFYKKADCIPGDKGQQDNMLFKCCILASEETNQHIYWP